VYSQGLTPPVHLRRYCFRNHFLFLFAALDGTGNVGKVTMTLPLLFKKKKKTKILFDNILLPLSTSYFFSTSWSYYYDDEAIKQ
jgi:hypothetical protein